MRLNTRFPLFMMRFSPEAGEEDGVIQQTLVAVPSKLCRRKQPDWFKGAIATFEQPRGLGYPNTMSTPPSTEAPRGETGHPTGFEMGTDIHDDY